MPPSQPNVLFLLSDQHSFRYFSHLDPEEEGEPVSTPAFDELAENSTVFEQTYCQVPLCGPSRIAMLTGREAQRAGAWTNGNMVQPDHDTIPERFADAGYETFLLGKMHFGGDRQFCGFNHRPYGDLTGGSGHQEDGPDFDVVKGVTPKSRVQNSGVTMLPESIHQEVNVSRETITALREHHHENPEQPWFLCASFSRPHHPGSNGPTAPNRHLEKYWPDDVPDPKVGRDVDTDNHPFMKKYREIYKLNDISYEDKVRARAGYFACVDYLDEIIGDLLAQLRRSNLLEDTIIVYTSDHGELAGEHGIWMNKQGWQEASSRVPWFIQLPEHRSGELPPSRLSTPVSLADLFPTLCGLAGLEAPDDVDGVDLSDSIRAGREPERGPVFIDFLTTKLGDGNEYRAVRDGQYKYVQFRDAPELLFDLEDDPFERENIAPGATGEAAEVLGRLRELVDSSIDFDAAEQQRREDQSMAEEHLLSADPDRKGALGGLSGNLYHLPDGRIVAADSPVYNPDVVTENPSDVFADWPEDQ